MSGMAGVGSVLMALMGVVVATLVAGLVMATGVVWSVGALLVEGVVGFLDTGKGDVFLTLEVGLVAGAGDIGVLADAAGRLLVVGASLRDVAGGLLCDLVLVERREARLSIVLLRVDLVGELCDFVSHGSSSISRFLIESNKVVSDISGNNSSEGVLSHKARLRNWKCFVDFFAKP